MELDRVSGKPTAGTEPENLSPAWGPPTQASLGERGVGPAGKAGRKAPLGALPVENVPVAALLAAAAGGDAAVQVHQPRAKELHDLRQHHWGAAGRGVGWAQGPRMFAAFVPQGLHTEEDRGGSRGAPAGCGRPGGRTVRASGLRGAARGPPGQAGVGREELLPPTLAAPLLLPGPSRQRPSRPSPGAWTPRLRREPRARGPSPGRPANQAPGLPLAEEDERWALGLDPRAGPPGPRALTAVAKVPGQVALAAAERQRVQPGVEAAEGAGAGAGGARRGAGSCGPLPGDGAGSACGTGIPGGAGRAARAGEGAAPLRARRRRGLGRESQARRGEAGVPRDGAGPGGPARCRAGGAASDTTEQHSHFCLNKRRSHVL